MRVHEVRFPDFGKDLHACVLQVTDELLFLMDGVYHVLRALHQTFKIQFWR